METYSVFRGVDRRISLKGFDIVYVGAAAGLFLLGVLLFVGIQVTVGSMSLAAMVTLPLLASGGLALAYLNRRLGYKGILKLRAGWSQPAGLRRYRRLRRLMVVKG